MRNSHHLQINYSISGGGLRNGVCKPSAIRAVGWSRHTDVFAKGTAVVVSAAGATCLQAERAS